MSRGYFGIGVEGISKAGNLGTLLRSAHAFGAGFAFTIAPDVNYDEVRRTDTSVAADNLPYYEYESVAGLMLPRGCSLVAVEFIDGAAELPSFRHPQCAAYVMGSEMSSVSRELLSLCDHVIKIPTKFCINVGIAGALVMYDRMISCGKFAERPVRAGGPVLQDIPAMVGRAPVVHRRKTRKKALREA